MANGGEISTEAFTLKQSKVHIHINSLKFLDNLKLEKSSVVFQLYLLRRNASISSVNQDFEESLLLGKLYSFLACHVAVSNAEKKVS